MVYTNMVARVAQILMGIVFLGAGLFKIWEPIVFYWEALPFTRLLGMEENGILVAKMAMFLGPLESALGLALLLNWRPKLCLGLATGLMAGFTLLMIYAWRQGANIDCGCFGALFERTPGEAAVADLIMLIMCVWSWWVLRDLRSYNVALGAKIVAGMAVLSLVIAGAKYIPDRERLNQSDLQVGVRLNAVALMDSDLDLLKGEYLVELFSPKCGHCQRAVPKMNRLADLESLPSVIALHGFPQDSPWLVEFKKKLRPRYTIAAISSTDFTRLTWRAAYPRLAFVKDGIVQKVWEADEIPDQKDLEKAIYGKGSGDKSNDNTDDL